MYNAHYILYIIHTMHICVIYYIYALQCIQVFYFYVTWNIVYINIGSLKISCFDDKQRITLLKRCCDKNLFEQSQIYVPHSVAKPHEGKSCNHVQDLHKNAWFTSMTLVHLWFQPCISMTNWAILSDGRGSTYNSLCLKYLRNAKQKWYEICLLLFQRPIWSLNKCSTLLKMLIGRN